MLYTYLYIYIIVALAISIKIVCSRSVESEEYILLSNIHNIVYDHYIPTYNINSWKFTTDHDDIGILNNINYNIILWEKQILN